ncbi:hypothetical protein PTKIN_Ptkin13bG0010900 [Pterospermum kingtungense]
MVFDCVKKRMIGLDISNVLLSDLGGEQASEPYPLSSLPSRKFPLASSSPLVPTLFIIGDSTVDCGNNNFLGTFTRADHPSYGQDFDTHNPTRRFCNGRIPVDYLDKLEISKICFMESIMHHCCWQYILKWIRVGTWGYVMSEVEYGKPLSQVVKSAKSLGYNKPGLYKTKIAVF